MQAACRADCWESLGWQGTSMWGGCSGPLCVVGACHGCCRVAVVLDIGPVDMAPLEAGVEAISNGTSPCWINNITQHCKSVTTSGVHHWPRELRRSGGRAACSTLVGVRRDKIGAGFAIACSTRIERHVRVEGQAPTLYRNYNT